MLERLGDQLAPARELALDQPREEHHRARLEHRLVSGQGDRHLVGPLLGDDPRQLAQRPRRHVGLDRLGQRLLELRVLDAQPVGVGGDHGQRRALGLERERRSGSAAPRPATRLGPPGRSSRPAARRAASRPSPVELGQPGKVLGRQGSQVEARAARRQLDVALLGSQREADLAAGQVADHVAEQTPGKQQRALGLNGRPRRASSSGQAPYRWRESVSSSEPAVELDTAERRQRRAGRDGAADDLKSGEEGVARDGELHRGILHLPICLRCIEGGGRLWRSGAHRQTSARWVGGWRCGERWAGGEIAVVSGVRRRAGVSRSSRAAVENRRWCRTRARGGWTRCGWRGGRCV